MEKSRLTYIDTLKGLGIIFVVFGHFDINPALKAWIYSFHMPLFFFLSGYVCSDYTDQKPIWKIIKKNVKQILIPYFLLGFAAIIFNELCDIILSNFSSAMLVKRILALCYGNCIWENNYDYINTLWFLVCLFSVKVIYCILNFTFANKMKSFVVLVVTFFGVLWSYIYSMGIRLPFCLDICLICILFYAFGVYLKSQANKLEIVSRWMWSFLPPLALGYILEYANCYFTGIKRTDVYGMCIGNPVLFYCSAFCTIVGLIIMVYRIQKKYQLMFLQICGRESLFIMALHLYVFKILSNIWERIFEFDYKPLYMALTTFVFSWILSMLLTRILIFRKLRFKQKENN